MDEEQGKSSKSTSYKDYYYILGLKQDATGQEIQDAYHDLYEKYGPHVTVGGQDPEMLLKTFKDISEAYEILADPEKRREYDAQYMTTINKGDLRSLWTKFSGAAAKKEDDKKAAPAAELHHDVEITLKEALKGCKKHLQFDEPKPCEDCVGLKPVQKMNCPNCRGLGYTTVKREEDVVLPKGMYDKMEVRIPEMGKFDLQARKRGDLIITIKLLKHPVLRVLGRDITVTVPVTLYESILGGEIEIPTATGKAVMKIQPLTQTGRVYRLKGIGLAGADQLVTIEVQIPKEINDKQKGLFMQLRDMDKSANPRQELFE